VASPLFRSSDFSAREDSAYRDLEAGQVRLGIDLLSVVVQLRRSVVAIHGDRLECRIDDPNEPCAVAEIGLDLLLDLFVLATDIASLQLHYSRHDETKEKAHGAGTVGFSLGSN
jgi:hypothetical protein